MTTTLQALLSALAAGDEGVLQILPDALRDEGRDADAAFVVHESGDGWQARYRDAWYLHYLLERSVPPWWAYHIRWKGVSRIIDTLIAGREPEVRPHARTTAMLDWCLARIAHARQEIRRRILDRLSPPPSLGVDMVTMPDVATMGQGGVIVRSPASTR